MTENPRPDADLTAGRYVLATDEEEKRKEMIRKVYEETVEKVCKCCDVFSGNGVPYEEVERTVFFISVFLKHDIKKNG